MTPDTPQGLVERANYSIDIGDFEQAEKDFILLLAHNHDNNDVIVPLASLYLRDPSKVGLSICLLHYAHKLSKTPKSQILGNLGLAYKYFGHRERAVHYLERAAGAADATAESITSLGTLCDLPKAMELHTRALKKNPKLPVAHYNLGLCYLEEGRWEEGWKEYEWGLVDSKRRCVKNYGNVPWWNGQPGTVLVYGDEGLGDEIMFASMIPDLMKTNEVIFDCHIRLKTLFEKSFGIKCYGTREIQDTDWYKSEKIDYKISVASLGKFYRNKREDFPGTPYLKAEAQKSRRFRVGISWRGGLKTEDVLKRTIPLSWWKSIVSQDCEFISLQYTSDAPEEIKASGFDLQDFEVLRGQTDYYETAKLVKSCDLVISVATSVYHLAGALGVPTWVLVPNRPVWREQLKGPIPFYQSVTVFRQPEGDVGMWIPVIASVADRLAELLKKAA
jgi:tetratricopeptide (TPR) repeat protein